MKRRRSGLRRIKPVDPKSTGWQAKVREKASAMAAQGYAYEVRLDHASRWSYAPEPCPYAELIASLRQSTSCRVVGLGPTRKQGWMKKRWSVRVFLKSDADLFQMRLLSNTVFRVYRLKPTP